MAFTLFDLILDSCKKVGIVNISNSTGGTVTTLIDSGLSQDTSDDDFNNGTLFVIRSTGASSSIDGQFRKITDYEAGTGTFTLGSSVLSSGPDPTTYGYTTPEFPHELLIQMANDALRAVGDLVFIDKNTLTSSAATTEYQMEVAWKRSRPMRIDFRSTALRNSWRQIATFEYEPASAGSTAGRIIFGEYLPTGRKLRIWYETPHANVWESTAAIDERIHPELAEALMVERMYEYRNSRNRGSVEFDLQRWNDAKIQAQQARVLYPVWRPKRKSKILVLDGESRGDLPYPSPYGP
jgi:hypothetical protein